MPVSWRTVGNLWYTDWNGYYIASPMILKIMRKQEKHVMFEIGKCGVQNLANTLSIIIDNNIHVLRNNKDEKISFPEELTSELMLGREELEVPLTHRHRLPGPHPTQPRLLVKV